MPIDTIHAVTGSMRREKPHADCEAFQFGSADVCQLAAVTLRQLHWWDERKVTRRSLLHSAQIARNSVCTKAINCDVRTLTRPQEARRFAALLPLLKQIELSHGR